ncbi:MAG: zeta toxin family protein [Clostridia bacterium]|nr:zeta toxin family protein [Clostridia bacterium]
MDNKPIVLVFAGPNGSGKSTVTKGFDIVGEYINADDIKKQKGFSDLEAAQYATALRENAVKNNRDFTFETVLSSPRNVELLKNAKVSGYQIEVVFVLTANPQINVLRVAERVKNGGHDVPKDKIVSRYYKSLDNLSKLLKISDVMWVVDNSTDKAELIIYSKNGKISINETALWSAEKINKLISKSDD